MKKIYIGLFLAISLFTCLAFENDPAYVNVGIGVTNIAASTTNTTVGSTIALPNSTTPVRIWLTGAGTAAATNGPSSGSNLVVRISTASGLVNNTTNSFDTPVLSNIKLTMTKCDSATNTVSDYFEVRGAKFLRVGQIDNNFVGAVSNMTVIIGYPK